MTTRAAARQASTTRQQDPLLPPQTECLVQQSEQSKIERLNAHTF